MRDCSACGVRAESVPSADGGVRAIGGRVGCGEDSACAVVSAGIGRSRVKKAKIKRSSKMLQHKHLIILIAKIGFDIAENRPSQV